jgi:hypothetical protein
MSSVYHRQLQKIVEQYRASGNPWPASTRVMASWAIKNRQWEMNATDVINRCADDLARAMREEYYRDPQGRRVRAKHCAKVPVNGEQMTMWDDGRTASRDFMAIATQNRRQGIVHDCRQLKVDVDSFNDNRSPDDPIKLVLDFTFDVEETY